MPSRHRRRGQKTKHRGRAVLERLWRWRRTCGRYDDAREDWRSAASLAEAWPRLWASFCLSASLVGCRSSDTSLGAEIGKDLDRSFDASMLCGGCALAGF